MSWFPFWPLLGLMAVAALLPLAAMLFRPAAARGRRDADLALYRAQIASNNIGNTRQALVGTLRLTNNFTVRPTLDVQLSGNLRSASLTASHRAARRRTSRR